MSLKSGSSDAGISDTWSLAARLTVWYATSSFLLILLSTVALYLALVKNLEREDVLTVRDQVRILRQILQSDSKSAERIRRESGWLWAARQSSLVHVRILDSAGQPVVETPGMSDILPVTLFDGPVPADADPGKGTEQQISGRSFRLLAAATTPGDSGTHYIIQVGLDETPDEDLIAEYRRNLAVVLGIALIACTFGGYRIAKRGVRPIRTITDMANRVRATHLGERITPSGLPAELRDLANTFNGMLDRLAESFDRLARFSADLAHELRTPVNNLRGEVEVALGKQRTPNEYQESLGSALEECDRLTRMIDGLLFLARAEHSATQTDPELLDVNAELETVRAFFEVAAADAGVHLWVVGGVGLTARLDRPFFQRAIGNLITNAIAHVPRGGIITLAAFAEKDAVRVEVADNGCGIADAHLPFLFDRFYRVDRSRSSATGNVGLGLAIVKGIVELHGGTVRVESALGAGARFILTFPNEATR